jgi:hypothetical protein
MGFGRQPVSITSARFGLSFNFWKSEPSAAAFQNEFRVSKDDFLLGNLLCQTQVNSLEAASLETVGYDNVGRNIGTQLSADTQLVLG